MARAATIFIKPMTWAGELRFYLGFSPSNPSADPCNRLGDYFLIIDSEVSARCVADAEARRMTGLARATGVVVCPHYVGYERAA